MYNWIRLCNVIFFRFALQFFVVEIKAKLTSKQAIHWTKCEHNKTFKWNNVQWCIAFDFHTVFRTNYIVPGAHTIRLLLLFFFRLFISLPVFHSMFWIWLCLFWFAYSILCAFSIFFFNFYSHSACILLWTWATNTRIKWNFWKLKWKKSIPESIPVCTSNEYNFISFHFLDSLHMPKR